jgi:NADH-quinone oxidoreductase subunit K
MIPTLWVLILASVLFVLGAVGFFIKRDLLTMFLAVEVMLNAGSLAFIAFARERGVLDGQVIVFFIITVAAAEAAIGLAIILLVFRQRRTIKAEDMRELRG